MQVFACTPHQNATSVPLEVLNTEVEVQDQDMLCMPAMWTLVSKPREIH